MPSKLQTIFLKEDEMKTIKSAPTERHKRAQVEAAMTGRKKKESTTTTTKLAKQNELSIGRVISMEDTYTAKKKLERLLQRLHKNTFASSHS